MARSRGTDTLASLSEQTSVGGGIYDQRNPRRAFFEAQPCCRLVDPKLGARSNVNV